MVISSDWVGRPAGLLNVLSVRTRSSPAGGCEPVTMSHGRLADKGIRVYEMGQAGHCPHRYPDKAGRTRNRQGELHMRKEEASHEDHPGTGQEFMERTKYRYIGKSDQQKGLPQPPLEHPPDPRTPFIDLPGRSPLRSRRSISGRPSNAGAVSARTSANRSRPKNSRSFSGAPRV